jgi:hypothetical protein
MKKKLTSKDRQRLADPDTAAASDAAQKAARARYDAAIQAVFAEMKTVLAGRHPRALTGDEAVRFMALKAEFDGIAMQQKHFAEADLAHRLDPGRDGSETVDA